MRTHRELVQGYGACALARALKARGVVLHPSTPQAWSDRNSVPAEYWAHLVELGCSSLEDLADGARRPAGEPLAAEAGR